MTFVIGEVEVTNEVSLAPSAVIYDGAVVADDDLTIQVNNFYYDLGGTHGKYAGSVGNAVADDSTNYVYLDSGAALVINATGYPPSGMHIRLARVVASGGFIVRVILERAFLTSAISGSGFVPSGRKVDTTNGLQGGGDLSTDRTLSPVYGSTSNTVCQGNDSRLSNDRIATGIRTATTVVSVSAASAPTLGQVLVAASGTSASWASLCAGSDGWIQFNDDGVFGAQSGFAYDKASGTLTIGPATIYPNNPLNIAANLDDYSQVTFQNKSHGTSASTDIVLTADNGDDNSFYMDLGIGGSNYSSIDYTLYGPNDAYLASSDSNLLLGTYAEDTAVKFHLGGGNVENLVATLDATGFNLATGLIFKINGVALPLLTSTAPADVTKATAAVGVATDAARADHKHDVSTGAAGAQAPGDTADEGTATSLARSDHKHSLPAFGSSSGTFCQGNDSRLSDARAPTAHASTHLPGASDALTTGTPSSIGTSNSEGSAASFSRSDHVHNHGAQTSGTLHAAATTGTAGFMSTTDKTKLDGIASGATNTPLTSTAPADVTKAASVVGVSTEAARADHKHNISTAAPSSIGSSNTEGTATSLARSDHVHNHGDQSGGSLHSAVIAGGANGFMTGTDKTKLDGIASGAVSDHGALSGLGDDDHTQYVLADGSRAFHGQHYYGKSATDPTSPTPGDGDTYFNTALEEVMFYDGTRSKWLTAKGLTFTAGRSGLTAAGSFYRGANGATFGTNIGYPVPKGTLVGFAWSRTDSAAAILEVVIGGSVIATLSSSAAGITANWAANADFSAGLLQFRNQTGGNTTTDVQITAIIKRRI